MPSIPLAPVLVSTPARDASMLTIEEGRTIAASETTDATPLRPARDPVNAGPRVRVEWAGRCRACEAPIWASAWPGTRHQAPRLCPDCGGGPVFRRWHVRQGPERPGSVIETRVNGVVPGCHGDPLADPPKSREFETGFVTPPTRRGARRGGRPRIYSGSAARQRAYRARQLTLLVEPRPEDGGAQ
jgi:hypothetical protein